MKYIIMLGDGMADEPVPELNGQTPLERARKPYMDHFAQNGAVGMVRTIPAGMHPGSDPANLSVMGYDPLEYYTGRSSLEAVSMGIDMRPEDVAYRCNFVTLSDAACFEDAEMVSYCAGEISTEEAKELVEYLDGHLRTDTLRLYAGFGYRHCLLAQDIQPGSDTTPPHDIPFQPIRAYLPKGENNEMLLAYMKRSYQLLRDHPINRARVDKGLPPANACWLWGEGTRPRLPDFQELYGLRGCVITAVDLVRGITICAGMDNILVEGATGNTDTNYRGKGEAALHALQSGYDYVYIHVEAPDECGHRHEVEEKIEAIERIDEDILGPLTKALSDQGEAYSLLILPDHPTPLRVMSHTADPVPFVLYRSDREIGPHAAGYTEAIAQQTGLFVPRGCEMMGHLLAGGFEEREWGGTMEAPPPYLCQRDTIPLETQNRI